MTETRIKISSIIENQLPQFVREEFPLVYEFLTQYYTSIENQGSTLDVLQNIDRYIKVDNLTSLVESTELTSNVSFFDSTINVTSTAGFPNSYGLILIDSEIITYTSKTSTSFEGCVRGFSGVTSYNPKGEIIFSDSDIEEHNAIIDGNVTKVVNLSVLFLKEFLVKVKKQFTPGFENKELFSELNQNIFIKQSIDFYSSKGTDRSFKILFKALYGENVEVIKPRDYVIQASDAQYRITANLVVESIEGDPQKLINSTLYQDEDDFISKSQGTITKVEKISRGSKFYYVISLDYDYDKDIQPKGTIYGDFTIHPKTKSVLNIPSGSNTIEVDSTVAFPQENGKLIVDFENGSKLNITYASKTLNQFLECSGITQDIPEASEIKLDSFAYGKYFDEIIKVRVLGVLSDLELPQNTKLYSEGDVIKIKTLGADLKSEKFNNWFFNISIKYDIESFSLEDSLDKSYSVKTYDDNLFKIGDLATFISSSGDQQVGEIYSIKDKKTFSIRFGPNGSFLNQSISYVVNKNLSKVLADENYQSITKYTSNVQNIYVDSDNSLYVSSPSFPTYLNLPLKINDRSIVFSGGFLPDDEDDLSKGTTLEIGRHGLYTGDSITYNPLETNNLGISTGKYFVKKISDTKIKLSTSRSNLFDDKFIPINATVFDNVFVLSNFTYGDFSKQLLESQKLIRKISSPKNDIIKYETKPGSLGIFVNGVEILNYKSNDNIYYGPIQKIVPTSSGSGYDVINPPVLSITDNTGSDANAYCSVIGKLERVDIINPGFDYLEDPKITITGGNGSGCLARAKLVSFDHEVTFNSINSANIVKLNPINSIVFPSDHKFRDNEEVVYITNSQTSVGGLSTNSTYFISVQDAYTVKLHKSFSDSVSGINTIQLTSYGQGNHSFKSKSKKKRIGSVIIESKGSNYQNKLTEISISGINTASNIITIPNHGYQSGEIIVYNSSESPIGGLTSSTSYYVTKIDDNQFKLSQIGIGTLGVTSSFYYQTKQYVNLTSTGTGKHKFNYPEINLSISGKIGISTLSGQNYEAILNPIFRGEIQSVFVESGGSKYGSDEIINYNKQPSFDLNSGSDVSVRPIISNGKIEEVIINNSGSGYNSPPNIIINGTGVGALLSPVIDNGSITEIKVIYGGIGYDSNNTSIDIIPAGSGAEFYAEIKPWKINLVERLIRNLQINDDDGILTSGINSDYGLQYTHAYAPRYLRRSVQGIKIINGQKIYSPDLELDTNNGREINSTSHSPIIGWAYDGNPIYGPYGYLSETGIGSSIRSMISGYELIPSPDRPGGTSETIYPYGFFIDDYVFTNNGDLDEYNGRFSITPEYPNGVYAYFSTINNGLPEVDGLFSKYKKPVFPYIIGPTYKSIPIDFNFNASSNQDRININEIGWKRNITPYNILSERSSYDYLDNPNKIKESRSIVRSVSSGSVDFVGILTGGDNYKIGDLITFSDGGINQTKSEISQIKGKSVTQISVASSSFSDVKFYRYNQEFVGFTSTPHGYINEDLITITGEYDYRKYGNIKVKENKLSLTSGVGSANYTGFVTYFNVSGNIDFPNLRENDIYQIGQEQIKVINIDKENSRIRVIRNQNGTTGTSTYFAGFALTERTRKFRVNFGISTSYDLELDKEFYFDPKESVALGTSFGVGIVSTLYFSNPGVGITQITIPTQSIYLKDHQLNTGDLLIYSSNGGSQISVSTDGLSSFQLQNNSSLYVAKISNDIIGVSTFKVGLGSNGNFVSLNPYQTGGILYFTSVGTGNTHSLKTVIERSFTTNVNKNVVTVSTAETHGLSLYDNVDIDVKSGLSTTFIIKYDDYNRRLVVNPKYFSLIDIENNIINIINHGYFNGQKVIHTSSSPASGLINEGIYYVVVIDNNKIKLSDSYYNATKDVPDIINIISSSFGFISMINPPISAFKNQTIIFDLSDSSLSFNLNSNSYSAFDFIICEDNSLKNEFVSTKFSNTFEVAKNGKIGIDANANVTLKINDNIEKDLFYTLKPTNQNLNSNVKKEIYIDNEILSSNKILIKESGYNGNYDIIGITSNTFQYNILDLPEVSSYNSGVEYSTNSSTASGEIDQISIISGSNRYQYLPNTYNSNTSTGSFSLFDLETLSIGKVLLSEIEDIGFNYCADYSVRPLAKLPDILKLEPLSSFDYIGISSFGRNYTLIPSLIVVDGLTNKVINDVQLSYKVGDSEVTIIKNTTELSDIPPKIIPINNTNGFKITNIEFNNSTKDVTVTLGSSFSNSNDYPFFIGGKVLIEGISVGVGSTGKGYNSSNYNYSLFTLTSIDPNIGGIGGTVTYNLSSYLKSNETPGIFDPTNSYGSIVPESYFPIFNPVLKKNDFYTGEVVYSNTSDGNVEFWDKNNRNLKVSTSKDFIVGDAIRGKTSGSVGIIKDILGYNFSYKVNSFAKNRKGWNKETGFLNNDLQRIHDSDYYQYFSYDLRSKKDLSSWDDDVSTLNHVSGFKKFGNLIIETTAINSGISTEQNSGDFVSTADLSRLVNLNCVNDFDLAKENNINVNGDIQSNEIIFNSQILQDYIESVGNRVLIIDDISGLFNSNPRATPFSYVDTFDLIDIRSKKYIILTKDAKFSNEVEITLVTLIHDGSNGFLNQYGTNYGKQLGFFDFNITGSEGNLLFYPIKEKYSDYDLGVFSFSLNDSVSGIGTIDLGDSAKLRTSTVSIPEGTSTPVNIIGISTSYRSSKVLVQIGSTNSNYYQYDEITIIHNESEIFINEYGKLTTDSVQSISSSGIGTYDVYLSSGEIKIDLITDSSTTTDYVVNCLNIELSNSNYSGIGTVLLAGSLITSNSLDISSSPSPSANIISSYSTLDYGGSYSIISIEDKTNSEYQVSEFLTIFDSNSNNCYDSEFGVIQTNNSLGIITSGISGSDVKVYFTPNQDIDVDVKVLQINVGIINEISDISF